jgi:hypothetical protein
MLMMCHFDRTTLVEVTTAADLFALYLSCSCTSQACTTSYTAEKKTMAQQQQRKLASCSMAHAFTGKISNSNRNSNN